jgi:hypothetical protein
MIDLLKKLAAAAAEEVVALVVEALTHLHMRVASLEAQAVSAAQDPNVRLVQAFPGGVPNEVAAAVEAPSSPPTVEIAGVGGVPVCTDHGQPIGNCPPRCRTPAA